jgi:ABC-type xylose transport system permease subunit
MIRKGISGACYVDGPAVSGGIGTIIGAVVDGLLSVF